jgi:hypothetical protein
MFISEKNGKVFNNFRLNHQPVMGIKTDISLIENVEGKFGVEISERVHNFIRVSS